MRVRVLNSLRRAALIASIVGAAPACGPVSAPDDGAATSEAGDASARDGAGTDASTSPLDVTALRDATAVDARRPDATEPADVVVPPRDTSPPSDTGASTGAWTEMLDAINAARATARMCGTQAMPAAAPLSWNAQLTAAAMGHSQHMATTGCFSHDMTGSQACADGTMCERIVAAGYRWSRIGENIAAGQRDVASVMAGWLASPGHCANIMNANFREVGAALVRGSRTYWTQNFGTPGSATSCR